MLLNMNPSHRGEIKIKLEYIRMNDVNLVGNGYEIPNNLFSLYCGIAIKRLRKEKKISGTDLARILNLSQQQLSRYERGVNKFTIDSIFNISIALNISIKDFINGVFSDIQRDHADNFVILKSLISTSEPLYFY